MEPADVEPVTDLSPATWLIEEVTGFSGRVRNLVPATFDAFVRVSSEENRLPLPPLRDVLARHTRRTSAGSPLWDGWPAADAWR